MPRPKIDFQALASAALVRAESLLPLWLPDGALKGHEYAALNPTRGDSRKGSFSVNRATGAWADFATGDKGGDLVSLYAYLFTDGDQAAAARELAETLGMPEAVGEKIKAGTERAGKSLKNNLSSRAPAKDDDWVCVMPAPDDAPEPPKAHVKRGLPEMSWCYRDGQGHVLGFVRRFKTSDGGKDIVPLTLWRNIKTGALAWLDRTWPEPRPLYGLDRLADKPGVAVLVVEGEKCADVAQTEFPHLVVLSWPGGSGAVDKCDWEPLRGGRNLLTWADADSQRRKPTKEEKAGGVDPKTLPYLPGDKQPGPVAMAKVREKFAQLAEAGTISIYDVRLPEPGTLPDGWDIADAVAGGLTGDALHTWLKKRARKWQPCQPSTEAGAGRAEREASVPGLVFRKGDLSAHFFNAALIFKHRPEWRGVFWFNEFSQRVVIRRPPPWIGNEKGWMPREYTDDDGARAAMWLVEEYGDKGFLPSVSLVDEAILITAKNHVFHPVRDWLDSLKWDGTERIHCWLSDFLGAEQNEYTSLAGAWWLMGACMRIMRPGSKFDYCLVLEGPQGKGKSTALSILGGEWFGDGDLELQNKDVFLQIGGKLIYEIAELGAFARADALRQKSFLSRREDEWRPHYGRSLVKVPRQLIFGGTTNEVDWNKDLTGGRRFWPIECREELNLQGLAAARDHLFAEAYLLVKQGEKCWPNQQEQDDIFGPRQMIIQAPDAFVDILWDWCHKQVAPFTLVDAAMDCMKLDASKLTADMQKRIGAALTKICGKKVHSSRENGGVARFTYKPPRVMEKTQENQHFEEVPF